MIHFDRDHQRLAAYRLTNRVDIDEAFHVVTTDGNGESARTNEHLVQRLNAARGCDRARQLERQCYDLVWSGSEALEIGEWKISRQIDRKQRHLLAQDVSDLHRERVCVAGIQSAPGPCEELNLGIVGRRRYEQPRSQAGQTLAHLKGGLHDAVDRRR